MHPAPLSPPSGSDRQADAPHTPLADGYGRQVNYLRLSITDRCNLRCAYCRGRKVECMSHDDILRYEELYDLVALSWDMGIRKVRLTGGEPLVRKGFLGFVEQLRRRHPGLELRLTTNATLLAGKVQALKDLGLTCINISLDSLDPAKYARITGSQGRELFPAVRRAMDEVLDLGLKLKVNAVAMRGVNDDELPAFLDLARTTAADVRFIEYMPMGAGSDWADDLVWSADDILAAAGRLAQLTPLVRQRRDGPARMFAVAGGLGRLGVISPLSAHFCATCNRLRITPEGSLRTCLFSDRQYRLRPLLRHPALGVEAVRRVMRLALARKPMGFELLAGRRQRNAVASRRMSAIGG